MRTAIIVLAVLSLMAFASDSFDSFDVVGGATSTNVSVPVPGTDADWLSYDSDDMKVFYHIPYEAVWFNTEDFVPGSTGGALLTVGTWFWERSDMPWDTDEFYLEIWSGDELMTDELIIQKKAIGIHADVCTVDFTDITVESIFWVVVNASEFSQDGWPGLLADDSKEGGHGRASNDGSTWVDINDVHIRAYVELATGSLENSTWGSIKAIF